MKKAFIFAFALLGMMTVNTFQIFALVKLFGWAGFFASMIVFVALLDYTGKVLACIKERI